MPYTWLVSRLLPTKKGAYLYRNRKGKRVVILFKSNAVKGRCVSPDGCRLTFSMLGGALKEQRRRRAEKRVVQKGVFGESVSTLPP